MAETEQDLTSKKTEITEHETTNLKPKSRLFVPATLLFSLPLILLIHQISLTLKFPDLYSYILLGVGGLFFARAYMVSFLTLNYSYFSHKWLLFSLNLFYVIVSFGAVYTAIADLAFNSYPEHWFVNMVVANLVFIVQIWTNKIQNNAFLQTHLIQIIFLMISVGALWQKILVEQRWFLGLLAIGIGVFEIVLMLGIIKLLFIWEKDHINDKTE